MFTKGGGCTIKEEIETIHVKARQKKRQPLKEFSLKRKNTLPDMSGSNNDSNKNKNNNYTFYLYRDFQSTKRRQIGMSFLLEAL